MESASWSSVYLLHGAMTNLNPPVSEQYSPFLLPRDTFRTLIALAIIAITLGGWIYVVMVPIDRFALASQTRLWWVEQVVSFVLAIVCIGIVLRKRSLLTPAFWLTVYSLVFDVMRWIFEFKEGQLRLPIVLILYALFIWRLQLARRTVAGEQRGLAV